MHLMFFIYKTTYLKAEDLVFFTNKLHFEGKLSPTWVFIVQSMALDTKNWLLKKGFKKSLGKLKNSC